ncbi:hypothetical protein JNUCC1_02737 [Lentibacillus sp. JNUCC-1]|uniref:DUF948 domain-containing protein n=1 Tax=Lentibacillus sp. JNUCC-1 TaxID=2654513 RepID=UPI0012E77E1A|nr:DUF948 domain-containing protein [Lentibacillus sp. JNUCC-1]MUV38866.1 hypothetical protein [Lentibacillus sp. JNUCC-1]
MDWSGIGLLILGIAALIIAIMLIKPLIKLAGVFDGLQNTTDKLPEQIDGVMTQAKSTLESSDKTLNQVNDQVEKLTPLFDIVGDAGRATQHVSSSMADAVMKVKTDTSEGHEFTRRNHLEGWYGIATLGYYIFKKRKG